MRCIAYEIRVWQYFPPAQLGSTWVIPILLYVLDDSDVNSDSTIPPTRIEAFELLAEDDVRVLIANSRSTSCCLDPIPTHLLKSCSDSLIPVITNIINSSLESGIFPDCWKEAVVIPLLKKPGLESLFKKLASCKQLGLCFQAHWAPSI